MTCIAWDGKTLAADKQATSVGYGYTVTKVHRVDGKGLVAFSGDGDGAMALLAWFRGGMNPAEYPAGQKDNDVCGLFIDTSGRAMSYGKSAFPQTIEGKFYAMGCGRDYALAAMHLGKSAREAVEVACALDSFCGNGIDTLELR
jgi:ATP-dependent protease HslVU (ClpYQ) peptidase subunit